MVCNLMVELLQERVPAANLMQWHNFISLVWELDEQHQAQGKSASWIDDPINHYKLTHAVVRARNETEITLSLWCLDPGQAF